MIMYGELKSLWGGEVKVLFQNMILAFHSNDTSQSD